MSEQENWFAVRTGKSTSGATRLACVFSMLAATLWAQNPFAGDPKAAKAGEYEFRINCALCHGLGARGGGRGPDLTRPQKKHTHSDADMFQVMARTDKAWE